MLVRCLAIGTAALTLASCDAVMDQASGQMRAAAVDQCLKVSDTLGVASDLVQPVCECTADTLIDKGTGVADVDTERMREIVSECARAEAEAALDEPIEPASM